MTAPRTPYVRLALAPIVAAALASLSSAALVLTWAPQARGEASAEAPLVRDEAPAGVAAVWGLPPAAALADAEAIGAAVEFAALARFAEAAQLDAIRRFGEAVASLPPPVADAGPPPPATSEEPPAGAAPAPPPAPPAPPPPPAPAAPPPAPPAPPPAPAPAAPPVAAGLDTRPMDAFERGLFDGTNARRAAQGLPPLRANANLVGIARLRSQDMADHDYFAHTSPVSGDTAFSLMDAYGIGYGWAGENLALNNYPPDECVAVAEQALWDSPPHRENMLNPHYTEMGIGHRVGVDGKQYFTVVFTGPA